MTDDDRLHALDALDPTADPARLARLQGAIRARAAAELTRRRLDQGPLGVADRWSRPLMAAAAVVMLVSGAVLLSVPRPDPASVATAGTLGVSGPLSGWAERGTLPSPAELFTSLEGSTTP